MDQIRQVIRAKLQARSELGGRQLHAYNAFKFLNKQSFNIAYEIKLVALRS